MESKDFEQIKNEVSLMRSDMTYIKNAITGAGLHKDNGILDVQKKQQNDIDRLKKFQWTIVGAASALSTVVSIVISIVTKK